MIAVDWGTTRLRAYRLAGGHIRERRDSGRGIATIPAGGFDAVLRETVGDWLATGETAVLMAGMVGSRQGWIEAPYLDCPADMAALAAALIEVPFDGATVAIVPGLRSEDASATPEVMRGEETQLVGLMVEGGPTFTACLPGTHAKWANVAERKITRFITQMTGEVFDALSHHTILARMMRHGPDDPAAFLRGVARADDPGGLLHHLFGVRTLALFERLSETESASYLSGLLIGHELRAVAPIGPVYLVGTPALCARYALALEHRGVPSVLAPTDLAAAGLAAIAEKAGWKN